MADRYRLFMPSNPDNIFSFRSGHLAAFYDQNYGRKVRHTVAKVHLENYRLLLMRSMPKLAKHEALTIYRVMPSPSRGDLIFRLADSDSVLIHKIRDWSEVEWLAVQDGRDRVRGDKYRPDDHLVSELRRVGLIGEEANVCRKDHYSTSEILKA